MIDSSGKLPSGFLTLDSESLGNYDECLDVVVPELFQGQYCNVDVNLPLPERRRFTSAFIEGLPEFENFSRSVSADSVTFFLLLLNNKSCSVLVTANIYTQRSLDMTIFII